MPQCLHQTNLPSISRATLQSCKDLFRDSFEFDRRMNAGLCWTASNLDTSQVWSLSMHLQGSNRIDRDAGSPVLRYLKIAASSMRRIDRPFRAVGLMVLQRCWVPAQLHNFQPPPPGTLDLLAASQCLRHDVDGHGEYMAKLKCCGRT